jgi:hypothetical protein
MMRRKVYKARTVQVGNRLIILDGHNPIRWFNLATNKVHEYKSPTKAYKFNYKISAPTTNKESKDEL